MNPVLPRPLPGRDAGRASFVLSWGGRRLAAVTVGACFWVLAGCGPREDEKFVPVTGRVTLDGRPLSVGAVSFRPDGARGNASMHVPTGDIDAAGNYELVTVG